MDIGYKAKIGDEIYFKFGIKGIVGKVYDNSVIVIITENNTHLTFERNTTVVGHKNYKILTSIKEKKQV
ncbi:DUF2187 domain-containing protein [Virgibacillus indicus]|uniref:DUF2187 domain-containing protein n=1 Tax=Virgibacillus indicus TaxID=2024554 RepID=A0A265NAM1_9BACI|nr:DUF2187 family protein [Virgibacillus indicus]OZU89090.1 DUF2187 domain-containing protein [Virgibacillus indicus]